MSHTQLSMVRFMHSHTETYLLQLSRCCRAEVLAQERHRLIPTRIAVVFSRSFVVSHNRGCIRRVCDIDRRPLTVNPDAPRVVLASNRRGQAFDLVLCSPQMAIRNGRERGWG